MTTLVIKDAAGDFRDTFSPGEQVVFELSITNLRNQSLTATRSSGLVFDFFVAPAGTRQVVWQWSADKGVAPVVQTDEFAPGETKTHSVMWYQHRENGLPLSSGEYVARGIYAAGTAHLPANLFEHSEFGSDLLPFAIE